jgi:hypothetical protein
LNKVFLKRVETTTADASIIGRKSFLYTTCIGQKLHFCTHNFQYNGNHVSTSKDVAMGRQWVRSPRAQSPGAATLILTNEKKKIILSLKTFKLLNEMKGNQEISVRF